MCVILILSYSADFFFWFVIYLQMSWGVSFWRRDVLAILSPEGAFFFFVNWQVILKLVSKCKEPRIVRTISESWKMLGNLSKLISVINIKLQSSMQCGIRFGTDKQINAQKWSHKQIVNWFFDRGATLNPLLKGESFH